MRFQSKHVEVAIHIIGWLCLLGFPILFQHHNETIDWHRYMHGLFIPLVMLVMFYLNYLVLVPKYFMKRRYSMFFVFNVVAIIVCCFAINRYMSWSCGEIIQSKNFGHDAPYGHGGAPHHGPGEALHRGTSPHRHGPQPPNGPMFSPLPGKPQGMMPKGVFFVIRDVFSLVMTMFTALAIRLSIEWHKSELVRQKYLTEHADAALKNLKAQTSPHFLLNTLNNIYSLTAFDPEKAQTAILELSKMLRYQLYESDSVKVLVRKEADFLRNYIELMRLRLDEKVKIDYSVSIAPDESIVITPHVLICLVENAFKHGICAKSPSFISIKLEADLDKIHFVCTNSNFPKCADTDKTPGGIGLQQVKQRLEHVYREWYRWESGPSEDGTTYTSEITIFNDSKPS